ncbi:disA bacterial checkpoint controller linker region family protein [Clostridioides difficile DA00193]|nr:disA bacterial checkpoint controller linker region family protein [Clostridioides difficile DA00193]
MGTTRIDQKLIFKDYNKENTEIKELMKKVKNLNPEELIELVNMAKLLGYSGFSESMDMPIKTRGYRILSKIHRLPTAIIENLVNYFENFQQILDASIEELDEVEGIGEIRATYIKNGLIKMKQLVLLDRHI